MCVSPAMAASRPRHHSCPVPSATAVERKMVNGQSCLRKTGQAWTRPSRWPPSTVKTTNGGPFRLPCCKRKIASSKETMSKPRARRCAMAASRNPGVITKPPFGLKQPRAGAARSNVVELKNGTHAPAYRRKCACRARVEHQVETAASKALQAHGPLVPLCSPAGLRWR